MRTKFFLFKVKTVGPRYGGCRTRGTRPHPKSRNTKTLGGCFRWCLFWSGQFLDFPGKNRAATPERGVDNVQDKKRGGGPAPTFSAVSFVRVFFSPLFALFMALKVANQVTGGVLFREDCFGKRENSVSSAKSSVSSAKELGEFALAHKS